MRQIDFWISNRTNISRKQKLRCDWASERGVRGVGRFSKILAESLGVAETEEEPGREGRLGDAALEEDQESDFRYHTRA